MKISIIIPFYNVERYIEKCIRSCENQDIDKSEYEIIVVNDGSPDGSFAIVERLSKEYSNIIVISQENQGLSGARNTGLKAAQGEYVWFVDSDDWIKEDCLNTITKRLNHSIDVLQIQYSSVYEDNSPSVEHIIHFEGVKSGEFVLCNELYHTAAQFDIYRREFLIEKNLEFVAGILHEDVEFKPRAIFSANSVASCSQICYCYLQRENGNITSKSSLKRIKDMLYANRSLYDFSRTLNKASKMAFNKRISMNMNSVFSNIILLCHKEEVEACMLLSKNRELFYCMTKSGFLKYILEGIVFSCSVNLGLKFYKLI